MGYPARVSTAGIILSGGGARGAYEAGVVAGLVEALAPGSPEQAPFRVFTGTSVGAINATWLAAHADRPDMNIGGLLEQWRQLDLRRHLHLDPLRFLAGRRLGPLLAKLRGEDGELWGRSLLDPRALEELVAQNIPYERLHRNVRDDVVSALAVAALEVASGRTTIFAEVSPECDFRPSTDPRRKALRHDISCAHVLASAAIPMLFPARRVEDGYYCDGGIRFNTPISPAIRCGADRLVVITLLFEPAPDTSAAERAAEVHEASYPSPIFLLGKVLNALLLDPVKYDLQVLERMNRLMRNLEESLDDDEMRRLHRVMTQTRGQPYRTIDTLVFRPSANIGELATRHAKRLRHRSLSANVITRLARVGHSVESDLLSFVLFDRDFAEDLIQMGRHDALARADEIRAFFSTPPAPEA